ncbi:imidazolonepropionase [Roseiarcus sp.]|uniref:imidazolonepropionase n=1 Tax=Roseiarcus sp. TaxID=1969460 RepID=UPI003F9E678D
MTADRETTIWRNARLATFVKGAPGLGVVEPGAIVAHGRRIVFAGLEHDARRARNSARIVDCEGRWITPGLIDCHTHLVYAGSRAAEFEARLAGASYEDIARAGGGIASTVRATRAASEDELVRQSLPRLDALLAEGVTTVEIKSGYGLDLATERKMLRAARRLAEGRRVEVRATFLGAHALPPEFAENRAGYVAEVADAMLPALAAEGLVDAVDGFCEGVAFSRQEMRRVFVRAKSLGLPVKLHAEQLSNSGGAALAAEFGALSAEHLEYASEEDAAAMARAGVVATLAPGAFYMLRETKVPPIDLFRRYGVPMAVSTDCNPGTSPMTSLLLALNMAATLFRLTVEECLAGITLNAARALGLEASAGSLEPGKWADLAIWDIERPAELVYRLGFNPLHARVWRGR